MIEALQDGSATIETLARAWDDEQRASGLAWKTRERRRGTLRSFVAFCERSRAVPRGVAIEPLPRERTTRGSIAPRVNAAIDAAISAGRWRDAAILTLLWDRGVSMADVQRMTIADLPVFDASDRCARALSHAASTRPADAWIFPGRDHRAPMDARSIRNLLARYGLPGTVALRRARAARLRDLGNPTQAARTLAGED